MLLRGGGEGGQEKAEEKKENMGIKQRQRKD